MKKKLLSLVMVAAFLVSIAGNFNGAFAQSGGDGTSNQQGPSGNMQANHGSNDPLSTENANDSSDIATRVQNVFHYANGICTSVVDANKGITVYSNGQALASFSYDPTDGTYSLASVNLTGAMWSRISAMGQDSDKNNLKAFLSALGLSESSMQVQGDVYYKDKDGKLSLANDITRDSFDKDGNFKSTDGTTLVDSSGNALNPPTWAGYANRPATDVAWLQMAVDTLKGGVNQGVSMSFNGQPTLTTITNGQAQATYNATAVMPGGLTGGNIVKSSDGTLLFKSAQYNYVNGFLTSVNSFTYEATYLNTAKDEMDKQKQWLSDHPSNANGDLNDKTDYYATLTDDQKKAYDKAMAEKGNVTYGITTNTTNYDAYGRASNITDANGHVLTTYNYVNNGSMVSSYDHTTQTTVNYVGGQVFQVVNSAGFITQQYNYNPNMSLNNIVGYNNGKPVNITAFAYGKNLMTSSLSEGDLSADFVRTGYAELSTKCKTDADFQATCAKYHVVTWSAYAGQLNNTAFMNYTIAGNVGGYATSWDSKNNKWVIGTNASETKLALAIITNNNDGISAVASANITYGIANKDGVMSNYYTEDNDKIDQAIWTDLGLDTKDGPNYIGDYADMPKDSDGHIIFSEAQMKAYIAAKMIKTGTSSQMKDSSGKAMCNSDGSYKAKINPDGTEMKDADGKTIYYTSKDMDLTKSTIAGSTAHKVTEHNSLANAVTITSTILSKGLSVYTLTNTCMLHEQIGTGSTDKTLGFSDPAVVGTVNSIVGEDGQTVTIRDGKAYTTDKDGNEVEYNGKIYAKVNADGVNMMDGSGFKPADGEEIFVELNIDQASQLTIGGEAMFMGDVSVSSNGKYTMTINENYNVEVDGKNYKGMVTGSDVQKAKDTIQNESLKAATGESSYGWMNTNTQANRSIFGLAAGSYLDSWAKGWDKLVNKNN